MAAVHLSTGPSLYGGGGLSPASGTVESFNEQLYTNASCNKSKQKQKYNFVIIYVASYCTEVDVEGCVLSQMANAVRLVTLHYVNEQSVVQIYYEKQRLRRCNHHYSI